MKSRIFLIYLTTNLVLGNSCSSFQCASSNQTTCVSYFMSGRSYAAYFKENICTSSQICDLSSMTCRAISTETNRLPGRKCSANSDCGSSSCISGVCRGLGVGSSCRSNRLCDVGLYCNSQVCATLLPFDSTCSQDTDCTYGFGCLNYKCFPWGTLPNGASIDSEACINYISNFCSSRQCYSRAGQATCIEGAIYSSGDLVNCTSDSNCVAKSGNYSLNGKCICGMNPNRTSYCSLFMGSSYGVNYWSAMGKWANSTAAKSCHKAEDPINALKDYGSNSDYVNYAHNLLWLMIGPYLEGIPGCVMNTTFPQYKDLINGFGYGD